MRCLCKNWTSEEYFVAYTMVPVSKIDTKVVSTRKHALQSSFSFAPFELEWQVYDGARYVSHRMLLVLHLLKHLRLLSHTLNNSGSVVHYHAARDRTSIVNVACSHMQALAPSVVQQTDRLHDIQEQTYILSVWNLCGEIDYSTRK